MPEQTAVQSFDPRARASPTKARMDKLLDASLRLDVHNYGLSDAEIKEYAALMQCQLDEWQAVMAPLDNLQLVDLARFFTLAERLPGWQAGDRSPVIAFMAELRRRDAVPTNLGNWIRRSTDNRFLPWGNLQSRL